MRTLCWLALVAVLSACAPKIIPAPTITTPRYPDFLQPTVPPALAGSRAVILHDRAWRFLQTGDLKNADREASMALQLSPDFYPAETTAGYVALARDEPKSAIAHFERAVGRDPGYVPALVGQGRTLQSLGRDDEAIAAYQAALARDPALGDVPRQIEVLRFRGAERQIAAARQAARAGRVDDARHAYDRALNMSPESAFLYRELAAIDRQAGDPDTALQHFDKAVELDPSDASSFAQIGELLEEKGDLEGAVDAYGKSLAIEPSARVTARRDAVNAQVAFSRLPDEYKTIDTAQQITRAQLAALVAVRLGRALDAFPRSEPGVITDIRGTWAETWIMAVARAGVMEPFANHTFQPRTIVRRVDLAPVISVLLARLAPQQAREWQSAKTPFSDLSPGHLAYPAASAAVASGVMTSSSTGAFQPAVPVTGAEAIGVIERIQRIAQTASAQAR
jgi:tetratricopeptide (TPR) repeat protein